jgi:hypothetical protein
MIGKTPDGRVAALLFIATLVSSMIGIFTAIFYLFVDIDLSIRIATAVMVGVAGVFSFFRHSIYYRSDQIRMGWRQEHPEFQLEVGYANLAIGIGALLAAVLGWGALACGMMLLVYGLYLLCAVCLHAWEAIHVQELRHRATRSAFDTGLFVVFLLLFAILAFGEAGLVPGIGI